MRIFLQQSKQLETIFKLDPGSNKTLIWKSLKSIDCFITFLNLDLGIVELRKLFSIQL